MKINIKLFTTILLSTTASILLVSFETFIADTKDIIGAGGYEAPENRTVLSVVFYFLPSSEMRNCLETAYKLSENLSLKSKVQ
jgi:hypothetical protein